MFHHRKTVVAISRRGGNNGAYICSCGIDMSDMRLAQIICLVTAIAVINYIAIHHDVMMSRDEPVEVAK